MIAPEDVQQGDLVAIFSPDGVTYRGQLFVREVFFGSDGKAESLAFNAPLPAGTTQGDILCLVRRRDEIRILESRELAKDPEAPEGKIHNGQLYLPSGYVSQVLRDNERLKCEVESWRASINELATRTRRMEELHRQDQQVIEALRASLTSHMNLNPDSALTIAQRYRDHHTIDNDCTFSHGIDSRCMICTQFDELISSLESRVIPTTTRRRIKSSAGK